MKKLVLLLTVILLALCLTSCGEEGSGKGFDYEVNPDGETCTITGIDYYSTKWEIYSFLSDSMGIQPQIKIPKSINGYTVTCIGESAFAREDVITKVVIPNTVIIIQEHAFLDCNYLEYLSLPDSITNIGVASFYGCESLESIFIPHNVTSIGEQAFASCDSLVNIDVDAQNKEYKSIDGNLYTKDGTTLIQYASGKPDSKYTISDTVTNIGNFAFENCSFLTSIVIGNSVTNIGNHAFYGCDSLKSITIPDSVTSIGECAFFGCNLINKVYISSTIAWCNITFDSNTHITHIHSLGAPYYTSNPMCYGANLYLNDELLTEIELPNTISSINNFAFHGCESLKSIIIPESVTSVGDYAFCDCKSLTSAVIGDSVTSIGNWAFENCNSLTSIVIPDGVTSIVGNAFIGCNSLMTISVSENNRNYKHIDGNLYTKDGKTLVKYATGKTDTEFIIPFSVTSIEDHAFCGCASLTSIIIPDSVTSIGDYTFSGCRSLTSITIPDSVTSIGDSTFYNCDSLTSITIPESITSIGDYAFYNCDSLTSITIPESVTSIGDYAFYNCDNLYIIYNNSSQKIKVGSAKVIVNKDGSISRADDGNKYILTDDGFLFKYKQGEYSLICYDGKESRVTLPAKINGSTYSLESVKGLTEVIIPDGITSIKVNSFDSALTSIIIPASVTIIDADAFINCTSLQNIEVSEENTIYKSIDGNLYTKDGKTLVKYAVGKIDEQFIIPDEIVEINIASPKDLKNIESVVIHNGVTNIANSAFSECENLEYVYFTGTQEEWKKVVIGENNDCLINAIIVYEYLLEE